MFVDEGQLSSTRRSRSGLATGRMMAVRFDVDTGRLSDPALLFEESRFVSNVNIPSYDVARDGRFLMIEEDTAHRAREIRVILNWAEELKRRFVK